MDDYEIVTMEDAPSPAPAPPQKGRTYEEVVNDTDPAKVFCINGICYYLKNLVDSNPVKKAMQDHGGCVACYTRAKKFYGLIGEGGSVGVPVFLKNVRSKEDGWSPYTDFGSFYNVRQKCIEVNKDRNSLKFFMVEENSFPPIIEGIDDKGNPYQHVTIFPDKVTSPENVSKYKQLLDENISIIQPRLEKLCDIDAHNSVKIIIQELHKLERPDHWKGVLDWVIGIQTKWMNFKTKNGSYVPYKDFKKENKIHLAVYALTTGRFENDGITVVHKDYKQSSNIVDFITLGEIDHVLREMDTRSNPENYMVSQLSRNMAKHKVSSKYCISLVWDGMFKDDLDIHLRWYSPLPVKWYSPTAAGNLSGNSNDINFIREIYYKNKHYKYNNYETRLDFDANASNPEAEPAENITCSPFGYYEVWVNNFRRQTYNKDIPFTIIIHQEGNDDIIIERTWPPNRSCGNKMKIIEHSFTRVDNPTLEMSTKAASRANVVNDEWNNFFGTPTSIVPNVEDLDIPMNIWEKNNTPTSNTDINVDFMNMAITTVASGRRNSRKMYLSEREANKIPDNLSDFLKYVSTGKHHIQIYPRSFAPGYVTKIKTNETVMKSKYSLNHYKEKGHIPNKPTVNGTTRFSNSWFNGNMPHLADVEGFVQFGINWFMVIKGTNLPTNDPDFPLCGGFHPGKLLPSFHSKHNYQWTFCNTQILPITNENEGTPLIGSFLVSDDIELFHNGKKIKVKVN